MRSDCQEAEEGHLCWLLGGKVLRLGLPEGRLEQTQELSREEEGQQRGGGDNRPQYKGESIH